MTRTFAGCLVAWLCCWSFAASSELEIAGLDWPTERALPLFRAPATPLDAINVRSLTADEQITFSALQGIVNTREPRLYLLSSRSGSGLDVWAATPSLNLSLNEPYSYRNKYELLAKYRDEINGAVLYDPARSPHYRNLACSVAAPRRLLPVSPTLLAHLRGAGIDLEVVVDLTALEFESARDIYQHLYDHYWSDCDHRILVSLRPDDRGGHHHYVRDMAAACGAAVVWLDPQHNDERALLRKFLGDMPRGKGLVLGWYTSERAGITTATEFGIGTIPSDFFTNATVHAGVQQPIKPPPVPQMPRLDRKLYVALLVSDGDNVQYVQNYLRRNWDESASDRGRVPLSWTIAPGLVDIAPGILDYYYRTATPQDCFISGPSGMGYTMPINTLREPAVDVGTYLRDDHAAAGYFEQTSRYVQRAGLRSVTIWDDLAPQQRELYGQHCPTLYGITVQNFRDVPQVAGSMAASGLRFERLVMPYVSAREHLREILQRAVRQWNRAEPGFVAVQVDGWKELKPRVLADLADELAAEHPGDIEFVRADHYFNLRNQADGRAFNMCLLPEAKPLPSGTIDFGATCELSRCLFLGRDGATHTPDTVAAIEVSRDGQTWQKIEVNVRVVGGALELTFAAEPARFARITLCDTAGDIKSGDVEWYGSVTK